MYGSTPPPPGWLPRLDFRRLPGPAFDPPRSAGSFIPEQRLVIEPTGYMYVVKVHVAAF